MLRHKDWRRGRAASQNLIPTSTGAAQAVGVVLPHLAGKIDGAAIRVPTINVSIVDLVFQSHEPMSQETLLQKIEEQVAAHQCTDVISTTHEPLVSSDFMSSVQSCIVDMQESKVLDENTARIMAWYDNEWAFSFRMLDNGAAHRHKKFRIFFLRSLFITVTSFIFITYIYYFS